MQEPGAAARHVSQCPPDSSKSLGHWGGRSKDIGPRVVAFYARAYEVAQQIFISASFVYELSGFYVKSRQVQSLLMAT